MRSTRFGAIAQRKNNGYIWDVYNIAVMYLKQESTDRNDLRVNVPKKTTTYYSNDYSFDNTTGIITLTKPKSIIGNAAAAYNVGAFNDYYRTGNASGNEIWYRMSIQADTFVRAQKKYYSEQTETRGTATGETVESDDINAYPANGKQNGYWYVLRT